MRIVLLDEASEIEEIVEGHVGAAAAAAAEAARGPRAGAASSDDGSGGEEPMLAAQSAAEAAAAAEAEAAMAAADELWCDMLHPSQRLHSALCDRLLRRFRSQLDELPPPPPPPPHDGGEYQYDDPEAPRPVGGYSQR